ncbi:hypothetical protein MKX03_034003 [Papaver bracteatum]|nr:hypothetical protein MKX03_034003 [Papaver bracteatum]
MNQISRFCVCRPVLRRNPFTRCLITLTISKAYPPQIFSTPGSHFRKFSGEAAAAVECNFDEDYLQAEIVKIHLAVVAAWDNIELGTLPDAAKNPADKFNAFVEKFGLTKKKVRDHPASRDLEKRLKFAVRYADAAGEDVIFGDDFKDWYRAVGRFSKGEIFKPENESDILPAAQDQIVMPVDDASAVVDENLADITNTNRVINFGCKNLQSNSGGSNSW